MAQSGLGLEAARPSVSTETVHMDVTRRPAKAGSESILDRAAHQPTASDDSVMMTV